MKLLRLLATVTALALILAPPADARKRHKHKPAGVEGVVLDNSCYGACVEPQPPDPVYTGAVTVTVRRAADGALVAGRAVTDGHFRIKLKRGLYDVSSVPPDPSPTLEPCPPDMVCALAGGAQSAAIVRSCLTGETKRVQVPRRRFTYVELHVQNVCIV